MTFQFISVDLADKTTYEQCKDLHRAAEMRKCLYRFTVEFNLIQMWLQSKLNVRGQEPDFQESDKKHSVRQSVGCCHQVICIKLFHYD